MDEWKIIPGNSKGRRQDVIPQIKHMWSNRNVSDYMIRQQPKIIESTKEKPFKVVLNGCTDGARCSQRHSIITATAGFTGPLGSLRNSPKFQMHLGICSGYETVEEINASLIEIYQDLQALEDQIVVVDVMHEGKRKQV